MDLPLRLAYVPLVEIRPAKDNGDRVHDLPAIIASIDQLGFIDSLKEDARTGRLYGGHGTIEALVQMKAEGFSCPAGLVVDDDGEWLVPILRGWRSDTNAEAIAANIALNQLPANGRYSDHGLARLLHEVATETPSLIDATGFDADGLDDVMRHLDRAAVGDEDSRSLDELIRDQAADDADPERFDAGGNPDVLDSDREPHQQECPACGHRFSKGGT